MPEIYSAQLSKEEEKVEERKEYKRDFLPRKSGGSLSSLIVSPSKAVKFDSQDPEEEILLIVRAHPVVNLPWMGMAVLLFFAPLVLRSFPLLESFPPRFQLVFVLVWYLILIMYVFEKFLSWFFNLTIITDERIVDVDFVNLTTKKVSDAELEKIQDVSFTNAGAFGVIFNYGNVMVQTAGEIPEFVFENVPKPAEVAAILQKLRTEEKIEALEGRVR